MTTSIYIPGGVRTGMGMCFTTLIGQHFLGFDNENIEERHIWKPSPP